VLEELPWVLVVEEATLATPDEPDLPHPVMNKESIAPMTASPTAAAISHRTLGAQHNSLKPP